MFTHPGIHKEDIKAEIRKRGKTLLQLSLENGLADATIRNALKQPIPTADKIISDFIEIPLHIIWPDRYHADGTRIKAPKKSKKQQPIKNNPLSHCQKCIPQSPVGTTHDK